MVLVSEFCFASDICLCLRSNLKVGWRENLKELVKEKNVIKMYVNLKNRLTNKVENITMHTKRNKGPSGTPRYYDVTV